MQNFFAPICSRSCKIFSTFRMPLLLPRSMHGLSVAATMWDWDKKRPSDDGNAHSAAVQRLVCRLPFCSAAKLWKNGAMIRLWWRRRRWRREIQLVTPSLGFCNTLTLHVIGIRYVSGWRNCNREFPPDQNRNRECFIQLILRRYLIHFDKFDLTNVPKNYWVSLSLTLN